MKNKSDAVPFRRPYDGSRNRVFVTFDQPSLTKQSFKDDCDINRIVNKFMRTGVIEHLANRQPRYLDCTNVTNYNDAINIVREAQEAFDDLPAAVRRRFENDPSQFLAAFDDPAMAEELAELGLLEPRAEESPEATPPPVAPRADPTPDPES